MFNVRLIKAEGLRRFLVLLFYAAAIVLAITWLAGKYTVAEKASAIILLVLVPFGLWNEYVRYIYTLGNKELNVLCDPEACLKHTRFVMKVDFLLHQYEHMAPFQEGYATIDIDRLQDVKKQLNDRLGKRYFKSMARNFEHIYLLFIVAVLSHDQGEVKAQYNEISKLFKAQERLSGDLITLKYFIEAIYKSATGNSKEALDMFEHLDTKAFKNRELTYYYYFLARTYNLERQYDKALEAHQKAKELSPKNLYVQNHEVVTHKSALRQK